MESGNRLTSSFLSFRGRLFHIVARYVPPHDIEDIVQETYVRVCQRNPGKALESPEAYMSVTARNLALNHIKRAENRLAVSEEKSEAALNVLSDSAAEPFIRAVTGEEFVRFCESVRFLPAQCRKVFVLRKVHGYSQREIAKKLNLSESTVEKHISKGMKLCTEAMRDYFKEPRMDGKAGQGADSSGRNSAPQLGGG